MPKRALRSLLLTLLLGCLLPVPQTANATPIPSAKVTPSSRIPGARPVALTIKIQLELQCGQPGTTPITITFPASEKIPSNLPLRAIRVSGHQPVTVTSHRHEITIRPAPPNGISCHVIAPGTLTIQLDKTANLGNPEKSGSYQITIDRGTLRLHAKLAIHP